MTIGSLLVSLTATTLGLAAFSPHAAEAGDFPSFSFMKFRLESMRPELESYVSEISSAKNVTTIAQASRKLPKSARLRPRLLKIHASRRNTSRPVLCCSKIPAQSSGQSTPRLSRVTNRAAGPA
jgi:hypothetical protein